MNKFNPFTENYKIDGWEVRDYEKWKNTILFLAYVSPQLPNFANPNSPYGFKVTYMDLGYGPDQAYYQMYREGKAYNNDPFSMLVANMLVDQEIEREFLYSYVPGWGNICIKADKYHHLLIKAFMKVNKDAGRSRLQISHKNELEKLAYYVDFLGDSSLKTAGKNIITALYDEEKINPSDAKKIADDALKLLMSFVSKGKYKNDDALKEELSKFHSKYGNVSPKTKMAITSFTADLLVLGFLGGCIFYGSLDLATVASFGTAFTENVVAAVTIKFALLGLLVAGGAAFLMYKYQHAGIKPDIDSFHQELKPLLPSV